MYNILYNINEYERSDSIRVALRYYNIRSINPTEMAERLKERRLIAGEALNNFTRNRIHKRVFYILCTRGGKCFTPFLQCVFSSIYIIFFNQTIRAFDLRFGFLPLSKVHSTAETIKYTETPRIRCHIHVHPYKLLQLWGGGRGLLTK